MISKQVIDNVRLNGNSRVICLAEDTKYYPINDKLLDILVVYVVNLIKTTLILLTKSITYDKNSYSRCDFYVNNQSSVQLEKSLVNRKNLLLLLKITPGESRG